jgi:hypothetical protein
MGYDATCTLTFDGRNDRGIARLEQKDLIFRGETRLAIPLQDVTQAHAERGTLHVRFGAKRAAFQIGDGAEKWAKRITNPPSRLEKLGIKPGMRVALVGVRDEEFERQLAACGAQVSNHAPADRGVDAVFYAPHKHADLARLEALSRTIVPSGAVWVLRPKGPSTSLRTGPSTSLRAGPSTSLTEADTMAAGKAAGLVDVKVVSFSDTLSAEKYMIPRSARPRRTAPAPISRVAKRAQSRRSSSPSPRRS